MTSHIPRPEILTEPQRRRRWSLAWTLAMVEQTYDPGVTVSLVARPATASSPTSSLPGASWPLRAR